jgi:hypothetical protein
MFIAPQITATQYSLDVSTLMTPSVRPCNLSRSFHIRLSLKTTPTPNPFHVIVLLSSAAEGLLQNYGMVLKECIQEFSSGLAHSDRCLQIIGKVRLRVESTSQSWPHTLKV